MQSFTSIAPDAAPMCLNRLFGGGEVAEFDIVRYKLQAGCGGHHFVGARLSGEVMEELIVEEGERYE